MHCHKSMALAEWECLQAIGSARQLTKLNFLSGPIIWIQTMLTRSRVYDSICHHL